jgi:DNA-binding MarR family transcriptional regulator
MTASPHLLMLDALLGLVEQSLEANRSDLASDIPAIAAQLLRLTELLTDLANQAAAGAQGPPATITAPMIRAMLKARRLRAHHLGPDIADAAWSLILALYEARLDRRLLPLTRISEAASVPQTTAHRWVHTLCERRILARESHDRDQRLALIGLSDEGTERVETYLKAAMRLSPRSFDASLS